MRVLVLAVRHSRRDAAPPIRPRPSWRRRCRKRYDGIRDFSADFTHTYQGGVLKKQLTERGRLLVKKPGKMRWDYTSPEKKQFVSDGVKIYSYIPADKQVIVAPVPPRRHGDDAGAVSGRQGNLTRDFTASLVDARPGCRPAPGR